MPPTLPSQPLIPLLPPHHLPTKTKKPVWTASIHHFCPSPLTPHPFTLSPFLPSFPPLSQFLPYYFHSIPTAPTARPPDAVKRLIAPVARKVRRFPHKWRCVRSRMFPKSSGESGFSHVLFPRKLYCQGCTCGIRLFSNFFFYDVTYYEKKNYSRKIKIRSPGPGPGQNYGFRDKNLDGYLT